MTGRRRFSDELFPYLDPGEADGIDEMAGTLEAERPRPRAALRASIRGRLTSIEEQPRGWQPRRPALLALSYVGSGLILLLIAGIGLAGAGPLAS